ncbi:MAG: dTDP-glucose 4,6-dehydratase [Bdellovibrionota bacterium]
MILVTGGAGFVGSNLVRFLAQAGYECVILDSLTYSGHQGNIQDLINSKEFVFVQGDICDFELVDSLFSKFKFTGVINLAAESETNSSLAGPRAFLETNIIGTFNLLEVTRKYWSALNDIAKKKFRFLHLSTDEVFGALGDSGKFFEQTSYSPNSPFAASKAGSDHLVRAWHQTYEIPTIITYSSNNYGPRQSPEKLIPKMISNAFQGKFLPIYGKGLNVRDWLHVEDHSRGLLLAFRNGKPGESYCFGGDSERTNIHVVTTLCSILDQIKPRPGGVKYADLIRFVADPPGHDFRYAVDSGKAERELGFNCEIKDFEEGLFQTVKWYIDNMAWVNQMTKAKELF